MRTNTTLCNVILALGLSLGLAVANDKPKGKSPQTSQVAPPMPTLAVKAKTPAVTVSVTISAPEREIIQGYVRSCAEPPKGKKAKALPPGLAKKLARGGNLPPGWQKKCVPGAVLPEQVYDHCHTLPHDILVKLPPPPTGTILVAIDGKVFRLIRATREILDVFDIR